MTHSTSLQQEYYQSSLFSYSVTPLTHTPVKTRLELVQNV